MSYCLDCKQPFKGTGDQCHICEELNAHEERLRQSKSWFDVDPIDYGCGNCGESNWLIRMYPDNGSVYKVELVCRNCGSSDNEPDVHTTHPLFEGS